MIGVNNLNTPTRMLVNRQPIHFNEAIIRYRELVPEPEENTVDPAVEPRGKRYDFNNSSSRQEFFMDNFRNKGESIYVIAATDNRSAKFTSKNKYAYNVLQAAGINALFGLWYDRSAVPMEKMFAPCLDTSFVPPTTDEEEVRRKAFQLEQSEIVKISPDGSMDFISTITDTGGA